MTMDIGVLTIAGLFIKAQQKNVMGGFILT